MKHTITIEEDRTGEQRELILDLPVGMSAVAAVVNSGQVTDYAWNIVDVVPTGEPVEAIPADPSSPGRPAHLDFARLSSALAEQDAVASLAGVEHALGVDEDSLTHVATNRLMAVMPVAMLIGPSQLRASLLALYFDAFQLGVGFTERGGHHRTEGGEK